MPTIDNWRALREALDAGPDEGPWVSAGPSYGAALPVYCNQVLIDRDGEDECGDTICEAPLDMQAESTANMNYIGEASPKVIRSLLDERDRLAAEVEALRADAGRYQWMLDHCKSEGNGGKHWRILVEGPEPERHDDTDAFNAAIDAAMKGKP